MAKVKNHEYKIDLDISTPQASKQALKELQTAFDDGNQSIKDLNNSYAELSKYTSDQVKLEKQYNKVIADRLSEKDKEIDKLKAEKVAIAANTKLTEQQKQEMIALKDNEIKRLEADKKYIRAKEKEAKILAKMNKLFHTNLDENSKSFKIVKNVVSMQEKLNRLLGKESTLRKAATKAAQVGMKGLKVAGGVAGALVGGAMASAGSLAEKEKALSSLKSGIDPSLVDEVYIKSGADFPSIVQALNTMSDVTKETGSLVQGAVLELQNPGAGKMLLSGTQRSSNDIQILVNAIAQIKKQTGTQDISAAIEAASRSRLVTRGDISQLDYIQAYSALAQKGLDEEKINRILRHASKMEGNFIDNLNKMDLSKFVYGQDKTRLSNVDLGLEKIALTKEQEGSSAQSMVEKLRQFELKKDELMMKFMEPAVKIMEALEPVINVAVDIIEKLAPVVKWLAGIASNFVQNFVMPIVNKIAEILPNVKGVYDQARERDRAIWEGIKGFFSGGQNAQGGVITSPSIVGEAGPELVLPLDYSRAGRTSQIINNFNTQQSFNMASNQNTPLALASAVGQNKFVQRTKVF